MDWVEVCFGIDGGTVPALNQANAVPDEKEAVKIDPMVANMMYAETTMLLENFEADEGPIDYENNNTEVPPEFILLMGLQKVLI